MFGVGAIAQTLLSLALGDLQENKIPIFEREGWQSRLLSQKLGFY